ncbi:MAG: type II CRISPR-associated endonuclease Cas1 [Planctomycetaceae bacterium]|nr:type II CRISPR-associated endonuclease Cas1 [Planctomycetaceae bacterium]
MRNRILEISQQPARLKVEHRQLVLQHARDSPRSIPLEDVAVLIVAHPQVSYTQAVLSELVNNGGVLVTCDRSRMPNGMLLPLEAHSTQTARFQQQFRMPLPRKKRLWQQVVRGKIAMQAFLLVELTGRDHGLTPLLAQVRSGDPTNVEARAARMYWTALLGKDFRRDRGAEDINAMLNYGYAILRAAMARAVCAAGLHPSVGLHHQNQYNAWCLADDMMEPFRPCVDRVVYRLSQGGASVPEMSQQTRGSILAGLTGWVRIGQTQRTFFDSLTLAAQSLWRAIQNPAEALELPEELIDATE